MEGTMCHGYEWGLLKAAQARELARRKREEESNMRNKGAGLDAGATEAARSFRQIRRWRVVDGSVGAGERAAGRRGRLSRCPREGDEKSGLAAGPLARIVG
jgi:hypothetical protein